MLVELVVENYAVVERLRVGFHAGLNLLTGETGSGKSIVVDALGLLYGARASAEMVRSGAGRARVAGIFEAPATPAFRQLLERNSIDCEDGELLLEREIQASGKSRAFLGSRPVTAALLKELAPHLGDIHGQHDQQELFSYDSQLEMLDAFSACEAAAASVAGLHAHWRECTVELDELNRGEQEQLRMADLWRFQSNEIAQASLRPNEDQELENERVRLANVARLEENAAAVYEILYESREAAVSLLGQARKRLEELCRIDGSLAPVLESMRPAEIAIEEAAHEVRAYLGRLEADPKRLDQIESRLMEMDKLKRKYGGTLEEIVAFGIEVAAKLEAVETAEERRAQLTARRNQAGADYEAAAAQLTRLRKEGAGGLEKAVQKELDALAMEGTLFRIEFTEGEWSARGIDRVRFLIAPNKGEEPRPLDRTASGGELSRLALALKTAVMGPQSTSRSVHRTLVFDEIDTGIGGATAEAVGRRLKKLASANQVICVTHLPQVAGFADSHYRVEKHEVAGRTLATVEELSDKDRRIEIGRMLSGQKTTVEALKQAEQLIRLASRG